jgi:hypothetical protein
VTDSRALTPEERALVAGMFGSAIDPGPVRILRRCWWPLQPRNITMAPMGHIHFHPEGAAYCDCFGTSHLQAQAFFLHEMTHVWQSQSRGRWYLPLMRHPFCRYAYDFDPGRPFGHYGIEQQAEIVAHVHLMRSGLPVPGKPPLEVLERILPFTWGSNASG